MFFIIFIIFLMSVIRLKTVDSNKSTNLTENIRRQLMRDNYDYRMSSENDDSLTMNRSLRNDFTGELTSPGDDHHVDNADRKDLIVSRTHSDESGKVEDITVHDKDLIYYMNDERLEKATLGNINNYDLSVYLNATTPKVKYKVLKVKNPNRRSMTLQRFIQEEKDDGVAIMNLNDGPFPEFRLPKSRRQYMQDVEDSMTLSELDDQVIDNSTQRAI